MAKAIKSVNTDLSAFNMAKSIKEGNKEEASKDNAPKSPVVKKTEPKAKASKKSLPESISNSIIEGCIAYDKTSDKGKAVRIPAALLDELQSISDKYYKRLSVRTMVSALIQTFVNDFNGEEVIDKFMDRVHYVAPTEEELEARKEAAEKAKAMRLAAKKALEESIKASL